MKRPGALTIIESAGGVVGEGVGLAVGAWAFYDDWDVSTGARDMLQELEDKQDALTHLKSEIAHAPEAVHPGADTFIAGQIAQTQTEITAAEAHVAETADPLIYTAALFGSAIVATALGIGLTRVARRSWGYRQRRRTTATEPEATSESDSQSLADSSNSVAKPS